MAEEKRFEFKGVDNGLSSMMGKLRQDSKSLASGLIQDAQQYSKSVKQQNDYISEQIKLIERRNRIDKESKILQASSVRDRESQHKDFGVRGGADDKFKQAVDNINKGSKEDEMQVRLLREIVDTIKITAREEIREDRKDVEKSLAGEKSFFGFFSKGEKLTPEEQLKRDEQRRLLEEEKETKSKGGRGLVSQSANALMSATSLATFATVGGIIAKLVHEGSQLQEQGGRLRARTGIDYESSDLGIATGMGVKSADFAGYAFDVSRNRGKRTSINEAYQLMATEKGFGMDFGETGSLVKMNRFAGGGSTSRDIQDFIKISKDSGLFKGGDFSDISDRLDILAQLTKDQTSVLETGDLQTNSQIMAAFTKVGGSFGDKETQGQRISTMSQALANPNNDFKQAFIYSVLKGIKPDASMFELGEMQEKGLAQPGFLSGVMGKLGGMGGSQSSKMISMMKMFGLSHAQARALFNAQQESPDIFSSIGSESDLNNIYKKYGDVGVTGRAENATGTINKMMANLNDVAAQGGAAGMDWMEDTFNAFLGPDGSFSKGFEKLSGDMVMVFEKSMNKVVETIQSKIMGDSPSRMTTFGAGLGSGNFQLMINSLFDSE